MCLWTSVQRIPDALIGGVYVPFRLLGAVSGVEEQLYSRMGFVSCHPLLPCSWSLSVPAPQHRPSFPAFLPNSYKGHLAFPLDGSLVKAGPCKTSSVFCRPGRPHLPGDPSSPQGQVPQADLSCPPIAQQPAHPPKFHALFCPSDPLRSPDIVALEVIIGGGNPQPRN